MSCRRHSAAASSLVFNIRVNAVQQALGAQLGQLAVEVFTGLAEEFIGGIAQAKHGKGGAILSFGAFFENRNLCSATASSGGSPSPCVEATTTSSFS